MDLNLTILGPNSFLTCLTRTIMTMQLIKDLNDKIESVSENTMSDEGDSAETFGDLTDLSEEQLDVELLKHQELAVKLKEQKTRKPPKCRTF